MVPLIRVPYYMGDLKRDPTLENYPYVFCQAVHVDRAFASVRVAATRQGTGV